MKDAVDILNEKIEELKQEAMEERASYEAEIAELCEALGQVLLAWQYDGISDEHGSTWAKAVEIHRKSDER